MYILTLFDSQWSIKWFDIKRWSGSVFPFRHPGVRPHRFKGSQGNHIKKFVRPLMPMPPLPPIPSLIARNPLKLYKQIQELKKLSWHKKFQKFDVEKRRKKLNIFRQRRASSNFKVTTRALWFKHSLYWFNFMFQYGSWGSNLVCIVSILGCNTGARVQT